MDNCSANALCINLVGSFGCECNTGFSGDGVNCTGESQYQLCARIYVITSRIRRFSMNFVKNKITFPQISTSVLLARTTAVLMLCVLTLRVVLVVSAILASVEMV